MRQLQCSKQILAARKYLVHHENLPRLMEYWSSTRGFRNHQIQLLHFTKKETEFPVRQGSQRSQSMFRVSKHVHIRTETKTQESWLAVQCSTHCSVFKCLIIFPISILSKLFTNDSATSTAHFQLLQRKGRLKEDKIIVIT